MCRISPTPCPPSRSTRSWNNSEPLAHPGRAAMSVLAAVEMPAHIPPELAVDFDFMRSGPEGSDPFEAWTRLHGLVPLVWTPRNGGHWLATRGEDIPLILKNHELFSSSRAFIGLSNRPRGVPLEYDP